MNQDSKPLFQSTKKLTGVLFLLNGLGMSWATFFWQNQNDAVAVIGLLLGTGVTLLGIKSAAGVMAGRNIASNGGA